MRQKKGFFTCFCAFFVHFHTLRIRLYSAFQAENRHLGAVVCVFVSALWRRRERTGEIVSALGNRCYQF